MQDGILGDMGMKLTMINEVLSKRSKMKNFSITLLGSTAPGLSWDFKLETRVLKNQVEIWFTPDSQNYVFEKIATVPRSSTYSDILNVLIKEGIGFGGNFINQISCKGIDEPWDQIIKMALTSEAELPYDRVGKLLSGADERLISDLYDRCGNFLDEDFIKHVNEIIELGEELEIKGGLEEILWFSKVVDIFDLDQVLEELNELLEQKETAQYSFLSLYKADINKIIEKRKKTLPKPTTMNTQIGYNAKIRCFSNFLEEYVLEYGKLPSGTHKIGWIGVINFDYLKQE